jgi:hypothetical protein
MKSYEFDLKSFVNLAPVSQGVDLTHLLYFLGISELVSLRC